MKKSSILLVMLAMLSVSIVPPAFGAGASETVRGTLEIVHGDDFDGHSHHNHSDPGNAPLPNMEYWLNSGSVSTRLEFAGAAPSLAYGTKLAVTGERRDGRLAVASYRVEAAPGGGGKKGGGGGTTTTTTTSYLGARDVLVVLTKFTDDETGLKSRDTVREEVFTGTASSSAYFSASSFGKASLKGKNDGSTTAGADLDGLPGDVTEWNRITADTSTCNYSDWGLQGRNAAVADGWNLTGYEHIVHVFPKTAACQWGGMGQLGGTHTWINGANISQSSRSFVVSHEIGHNVTLHHARSWECTLNGVRVAFAQNCDSLEYGDNYEVMGRGYSQLNARSKPHLGWLPAANMQTVSSSGIYTIQPIDGAAASGTQSLRIARSRSDYLWIEARSKTTTFDNLLPEKPGVLIHTGPNIGSIGSTYLIDGDPHTPVQTDAAFEVGEAFVDTVANIYVRVVSVDATGITVEIKTGYVNAVPTGSAGASSSSTTGAAHTHTGASASDVDNNLMKYEWAWTSCPSTCPALSGATGGPLSGAGGPVPGPTYTADSAGDHTLTLTIWDATGARITSTVTNTALAPASPII